MIEIVEEEVIEHLEESLKYEEEDMEEEPYPTNFMVHEPAGYSNP